MRESVIKLGVSIILIGAVTYFFGTFAEDGAYVSLTKAARDVLDTSKVVKAYEETRLAAFTKNVGLFIAMIGIAIAFAGIGQRAEASALSTPLTERHWENTREESSSRFPVQRT